MMSMIYRFNYEKLVGAVDDKGMTSSEVAASLDIPERHYLLKLCNCEEFTLEEISILADQVLEISPEEIPEYFFCREM